MLTEIDRTATPYDEALIEAYKTAMWSHDPSTQNGAVLLDGELNIVAFGSNNFPSGVAESDERWERPLKYILVEHAERNTIYRAATLGTVTQGLTMVCPWAACSDCARAIVQAGISVLVRHRLANDPSTTHDRWKDSVNWGDVIMNEGGVTIVEIEPIAGYKLRRNEQLVDTSEL